MKDKAETTGGAVGGIAGIALFGGAVQCSSGCRGDGAIDAVRRGEDAAGVWECGRRHSGWVLRSLEFGANAGASEWLSVGGDF